MEPCFSALISQCLRGMKTSCPYCLIHPNSPAASGQIRKYGFHYRKSDRAYVQRFKCNPCRRYFSVATSDPCYRQSTRHLNLPVYTALASLNSQRRIARSLRLNRGTIARKLEFLGTFAELRLKARNRRRPAVEHCQFDDQESFEHTKLKPLTITIAVSKERLILGLEVASMPAKGPMAELSRKKYGPRKDERKEGRRALFASLLPVVSTTAHFRSDQNPNYPADLKAYFPNANHKAFKGRKPRLQGQGELKKGFRDPLWALNHTCACFRANVNRLIHRTWCTTKKASCLKRHMYIYADYHNEWILSQRPPHHPVPKPNRLWAKKRLSGSQQKIRPVYWV